MSKSGYSYGTDEFDLPVQHGAPAGVHRTQRSGWRKTWPFLLVVVLFAGLAFGGFYFWLNRNEAPPPVAGATTTASADAPDDTAATDDTAGEDDGAAVDPVPEESPSPTPSEGSTGTVNKAATVRVLNGAGIQGLAKDGADVLKAAGYTSIDTADYKGAKLPGNTIYYKTPEMQATANDIAAQLGIPVDAEHVQLVPENQADVSVILMAKFSG